MTGVFTEFERTIKEAKANGASFRAVAKEFDVTPSMVQRVVRAAA